MTDLDFNTIKEEIDNFKDNKVSFVESVREEYFLEAFATINKIFNYSLESNDRLTKIKMHHVRDYIIFEFDKVSYKTNKIIKNIGICVDKAPLFLTSSAIHKNDNVKYKEESFCTYDLETSRIINRIRIKNIIM